MDNGGSGGKIMYMSQPILLQGMSLNRKINHFHKNNIIKLQSSHFFPHIVAVQLTEFESDRSHMKIFSYNYDVIDVFFTSKHPLLLPCWVSSSSNLKNTKMLSHSLMLK